MKITKERLREIIREVIKEESEYQTFFKKALEKTGKSIPQMSDEEKKAFFNKIDAAWNAKGEKKEAAAKFLAYLTSDEAMQIWLDTVGELPAKPSVALVDANKQHELYGPFIRGLDYATATTFISEKPQRQSVVDAYDMVVLQGMSPKDALAKVAKKEQELLDDFFGN